MSTTDRVAVIVVHGIADQRPGQTVREVARLEIGRHVLVKIGDPALKAALQEAHAERWDSSSDFGRLCFSFSA